MSKADIKAIDRIVREEGLSRGQRRLLHDEITGRQLTLEEIRQIARDIKELYPNKRPDHDEAFVSGSEHGRPAAGGDALLVRELWRLHFAQLPAGVGKQGAPAGA